MKLSRLVAKALTSSSSSSLPECRLHHQHRILLQTSSALYSTTTTKPSKSKSYTRRQPTKSQTPSPSLNDTTPHTELTSQPKMVPTTSNEWPRPREIPWQATVANTVNLIGYVDMPVKFEASLDGKSWAGTILTQEKLSHAPLWIPILFEGDLAHVAACHLKEKDFVHIAGQLTGDPPKFTMEQGQTSIQVMVHSLSFVQETLQRKERCTSSKQKEVTGFSSRKELVTTALLWSDLVANTDNWCDNRLNKSDPTSSDFKHKDGRELWVDDSTPRWIASRLDTLKFANKAEVVSHKSVDGVMDPESPWRDLINNPKLWLDKRKDKLEGRCKPNYPDFKQKNGNVALWLNKAPGWVLSELKLKVDDMDHNINPAKNNEAKKESVATDHLWIDLLANPRDWSDNRLSKSDPASSDFKHKDGGELWIDDSTPRWIPPKLETLNFSNKAEVESRKSVCGLTDPDSHWRDLIDNPKLWWDKRKDKREGRCKSNYPDFKQKKGNLALWLDKAPGWVLSELKLKVDDTDHNASQPKDNKVDDRVIDPENPWRDLMNNPKLWWDNRKDKLEGRYKPNCPDFKQKNGSVALWLNKAPGWVLSELKLKVDDMDHNTSQPKNNEVTEPDNSWKSLVENPNQWWDNRVGKRNPKAPDFKHKETGEALWLDRSPAWVTPKLPPVKSDDVSLL